MTMTHWMTAAEISARYVVGEQKLLDYALRGNLPLVRNPDGTTLFDESVVALYFRPRSAAAAQALPVDARALGVLGATRLGEPPAEPQGATVTPIQRGASTLRHVARRRRLRVAPPAWLVLERRKKAS